MEKYLKLLNLEQWLKMQKKIGEGLRVSSENDNRITKIGKILRKTSLDELPQLINSCKRWYVSYWS